MQYRAALHLISRVPCLGPFGSDHHMHLSAGSYVAITPYAFRTSFHLLHIYSHPFLLRSPRPFVFCSKGISMQCPTYSAWLQSLLHLRANYIYVYVISHAPRPFESHIHLPIIFLATYLPTLKSSLRSLA